MIIICPGFHHPQLTEDFITAMGLSQAGLNFLVIPKSIRPDDFTAIQQWLSQKLNSNAGLFFIGFSAGVVGAIAAAIAWQQTGGTIQGLIAIDGWGVPLFGSFPIYRVSHDKFTHHTSQLLGRGRQNFYCSPDVSHLDLWRSPDSAWGWWEIKIGCRVRCSAAIMINEVLINQ